MRQDAAPEIPWRLVADFRNVLAHQYLGVDLNLVWNIVEKELPRLSRALKQVEERLMASG